MRGSKKGTQIPGKYILPASVAAALLRYTLKKYSYTHSVFCCVAGYIEPVESEDYLALTDREEQDLEKLMSQCEFGISNAEAFMENLAKDLSILDGVCVFYHIFKCSSKGHLSVCCSLHKGNICWVLI